VSEASKEKVRRVLEEAFGQGKVEVIDEVLHSDFVCYDPNSLIRMLGLSSGMDEAQPSITGSDVAATAR
jgi:hypothetical protein